jgi:hypothetical protein
MPNRVRAKNLRENSHNTSNDLTNSPTTPHDAFGVIAK